MGRVDVAFHVEEAFFIDLEAHDFFDAFLHFFAHVEVADEESVNTRGHVVDQCELNGVAFLRDDGSGEPLLNAIGFVVHEGDLTGGGHGRNGKGKEHRKS